MILRAREYVSGGQDYLQTLLRLHRLEKAVAPTIGITQVLLGQCCRDMHGAVAAEFLANARVVLTSRIVE